MTVEYFLFYSKVLIKKLSYFLPAMIVSATPKERILPTGQAFLETTFSLQ
jgi:hypothetical protein